MAKEAKGFGEQLWDLAKKLNPKGRKKTSHWDFKQYVLGIIFYRYISENFADRINRNERDIGKETFNYAELTDEEVKGWEEDRINAMGFFIKPSELFENVLKQSQTNEEDLNEKLSNIFQNIMCSAKGTDNENNFTELFSDIDLNNTILGRSITERNKKIKELLNEINKKNLSLEENESNSFFNAYGKLLNKYASNSGTIGGESYTPPKLSELLVHLCIDGRKKLDKVYDPACGSGSLLLKFKKILGEDKINKYYGQEIDPTTSKFCRMNIFLSNVNYSNFSIKNEDTLLRPAEKHKLIANKDGFDAIVCNPPFNGEWREKENEIFLSKDERFAPAGKLAPKKRPSLAFVMHALYYLSNNGTATILCSAGALCNGNAEQEIRKYLLNKKCVDCVIDLAKNLFYGVNNPACILILKKNKKDNKVLFVDASREFEKDGNKNKLTDANIQKIINAYQERTDKQGFSKLVTEDEIIEKDWDLSVNKYIEQEKEETKINIEELEAKLEITVAKVNQLRNEINLIIKEIKNNMNN